MTIFFSKSMLEAGKFGKCKGLNQFDMGQTTGQSVSKTAALVGCSWSAVVSILSGLVEYW